MPMWKAERKRRAALGTPPEPGKPTFYKKNMVRSLFFRDEHFEAMVADPNPESWDSSITEQIVATGIGTMTEEIDGDHLTVDAEFLLFLRDPQASHLRNLCKARLETEDAMRCFFADIRDSERRRAMAQHMQNLLNKGRAAVDAAVLDSILEGSSGVVHHTRVWIVDILPLLLNRSHNYFNGLMYRDARYPLTLANPYPNIVIRSPRVLGNKDNTKILAKLVCDLIWKDAEIQGTDLLNIDAELIARVLLRFRVDAAIKLKKVDPLVLVLEAIAADLGVRCEEVRIASLYSGFSDDSQLGVFRFFRIRNSMGVDVICNVLAAYENPADKAKEWAARRMAIGYAVADGRTHYLGNFVSIFVLDGVWAKKDVTRLFKAGWSHIIRLSEVEKVLGSLLMTRLTKSGAPRVLRAAHEDAENLPMAAEED